MLILFKNNSFFMENLKDKRSNDFIVIRWNDWFADLYNENWELFNSKWIVTVLDFLKNTEKKIVYDKDFLKALDKYRWLETIKEEILEILSLKGIYTENFKW